MKTNTYLWLSLLIPLIVWAVCVLVLLIANEIPESSGLSIDESQGIGELMVLFFAFYVIGIIVWLVPYILLSLILFFWSFLHRAQTGLKVKVFALSPLAMMILTIAVLNILALGTSPNNTLFSSPGIIDQNFINLTLLGAAFALIWGYICVGIGFGIYKLLQNRGSIRDEENPQIMATSNQAV